jgi:long-chain acyl-CoA synthetase
MTGPATMLDVFAATARAHRDLDLVRYFDTPLTVGQVDELSDALASGLADLGVGRGDRVALLLQNVPQYPVALLAVWKLGAIAVACSPLLRGPELLKQLDDAEASALIALESLHETVAAPVLDRSPVRTVVTTSELDLLDAVPPLLDGVRRRPPAGAHDLIAIAERHAGERPPAVAVGPGDVAVLTYTSGTTGPAKGAMNTHGNLVHSAQVYRDVAQLDRSDVLLGIAPLFHVTGLVAHIAVAMLVPMPLVLACRFDAAETARLVERHRTTFTVAAITAYTALLNSREAAGRDLTSMTKAYSGGAPVSPAAASAWEERTGSPLHTVYGLTETTSPSHMVPLGARPPVDPGSGALSVGKAVTGTQARVVDPDGRTLPVGEVGEIAIRGPQVVPGYWRNPDATAAALPDGELRTGDVGLVDEDGWFYVVDRLKDLINASGFKVWPREVEDVLHEHPAVREVAVVGVPDAYRGETVKAFVALRPGARAEPGELVAFARERLAAYKYPRDVELVEELPKTASGKILRRELRAGGDRTEPRS